MNILIKPSKLFGSLNTVAVHVMPECRADIDHAFEQADRDMFPTIVFYVNSLAWSKYINENLVIYNQAQLEGV